jgi:hypothetical protein
MLFLFLLVKGNDQGKEFALKSCFYPQINSRNSQCSALTTDYFYLQGKIMTCFLHFKDPIQPHYKRIRYSTTTMINMRAYLKKLECMYLIKGFLKLKVYTLSMCTHNRYPYTSSSNSDIDIILQQKKG